MTIKKPASQKAPVKPDEGDLLDRVINAGSPPPPDEVAQIVEKDLSNFKWWLRPIYVRRSMPPEDLPKLAVERGYCKPPKKNSNGKED